HHPQDVDQRHEQQLLGLARVALQLAGLVRAAHAGLSAVGGGEAAQAGAAALWRSVIAFRNFTEAISRLSMSSVVRVWSQAWMNSSGRAGIRPDAVRFIATEVHGAR